MDTAYFLQQLINGVTLGSVYGLIAIGYTMVYGIIGMINFAHGDIFMVGAFIALISFILFALTSIALPIVLLLTLLIAMVIKKAANSSSPHPFEPKYRSSIKKWRFKKPPIQILIT